MHLKYAFFLRISLFLSLSFLQNVTFSSKCHFFFVTYFLHYIKCYLLDAFIQSDLPTQYYGQSPQEQFGVKCLAQGHNDMLTAVGFEPVTI